MSIGAVLGATAGGEAPASALAAGERVQRLQALIAQVESGSKGFAAALDTAQASASDPAASQTGSAALDSTSPALYSSSAATYPATALGAATADAASADPAAADTALAAYPSSTDGALSDASYVTASPAGSVPSGETASAGDSSADAYTPLIEAAAARNGLDPAILHGLIQQESGFDPTATSSAGALGLTQLMPATAASLGVTEPLNPAQSIEGGARYLGQLMRQFSGNVSDALAAYNAGPGAVQQYGGVPPYAETQQYVTNVLANASAYRQSSGEAPSVAAATPTSTAGATIA